MHQMHTLKAEIVTVTAETLWMPLECNNFSVFSSDEARHFIIALYSKQNFRDITMSYPI